MQKVAAYRYSHTGDHMADCENWHSSKNGRAPSDGGSGVGGEEEGGADAADAEGTVGPRHFTPYFAAGPPKLSARQAELYGLVAYQSGEDAQDVNVQVA